VPGFTYGPHGDTHHLVVPETPVVEKVEEVVEVEPESSAIEDLETEEIPLPPQFNEDGTGSKPPQE